MAWTRDSVYVQVFDEHDLFKAAVVQLEDGGCLRFGPTNQCVQSGNQQFEEG